MEVAVMVTVGSVRVPDWVGSERGWDKALVLDVFARAKPGQKFRYIGEIPVVGRNVVAARTGYHPIYLEKVLAEAKSDRIPFRWIGNTRVFFDAEVKAWLEEHGRGGRNPQVPDLFGEGVRLLRPLTEDEKDVLGQPFVKLGEAVLWGSSDVRQHEHPRPSNRKKRRGGK